MWIERELWMPLSKKIIISVPSGSVANSMASNSGQNCMTAASSRYRQPAPYWTTSAAQLNYLALCAVVNDIRPYACDALAS